MASQGPALDGLRAYFKMVNDAGGVKGNKINLIEQDDAYNVAKEVGIVKGFIQDDHVALVTGIGNSSGFSSILPLLNASKTPALVNQGTLKTNTYPFQPYMFQGNCNYGDQAEVALAYTMTRAKIKSLKGVKVGIAGIAVASGQEWIDTLKAKVEAAGGIAGHADASGCDRQRRRRRAGVPGRGREDDPHAPLDRRRHRDGALDREVRHQRARLGLVRRHAGPAVDDGSVRRDEELRRHELLHAARRLEDAAGQARARRGQEGRRLGRTRSPRRTTRSAGSTARSSCRRSRTSRARSRRPR